MKKLTKIFTAAILAATIFAVSGVAYAAESPYGSEGALSDGSYTMQEMLTYAL